MDKKLGVPVFGIKEDFEASKLPLSYESLEKDFESYLKLLNLESDKLNFELIEKSLNKILTEGIKNNYLFLKENYNKGEEETIHLKSLVEQINDYGKLRIQEIIKDLKNPKQEVGLFKSLIAKILN